MWTLLVLCSVIASYGVQGWTTAMNLGTSEPVTGQTTSEPVSGGAPCGGYLYGSSGTFYSPNYPNNYPHDTNCVWYIRPGSQIVELEFSSVHLENCAYDSIMVYDGSSTSSRLLGRVCGRSNATFHSTGYYLTVRFKTDSIISYSGFRADYRVVGRGSCRYNCGYQVGSCSCSSSCEWRGNCCQDYREYCQTPTTATTLTATTGRHSPVATHWYSCQYNCGRNLGICSCTSSCKYHGNCCYGYDYYCPSTTVGTTAQPSCRYNCGWNMGSCSCSSSCQYYGNCCYDYYSYCQSTTTEPSTSTTAQPSCRYNCGWNMGSCSCSSSCQYYGNCCYDYYSYCQSTTTVPSTSTTGGAPCGGYLYGSSGTFYSPNYPNNYPNYANCVWYIRPGSQIVELEFSSVHLENCAYDSIMVYDGSSTSSRLLGRVCGRSNATFHSTGYYLTVQFRTDGSVSYSGFRADYRVVGRGSCRYNCGYQVGSCSCSSSCEWRGNCCQDYRAYCQSTTTVPSTSTTAQPSCRYNCGWNMGSCSCSSNCQYYGNCCYDYYYVCRPTSAPPPSPTAGDACGGSLFGSGTFSSPNHPNYYYDNAYCSWQLRAAYDQRIVLTFTYLQLENCCSCDYIKVFDGPSVSSRYLGTVCNDTLISFYSTSNYMTVLFRTDSSVVGRGFSANFMSSLSPSSGRVDCSSDNMNIVVERSYLNSLGYDGHTMYLNDPQCRPQITYYQVVFSFPINTCGNVQKFENGRVVYTNTLRAYTTNSGEITRQTHLKLNVACRMEQDSVAQIMYVVHHDNNSSITGTGRFNTSMDFYTSSSFYYKVTQVPYEVFLNQNLYVQVDLRRADSSLVLFLDTCVASPSPHDFHTRAYYLVRNGCPADDTYRAYVTGTRAYARFTFKAFKFLRATESVYIQCKVLICPASDNNSRCRRGCVRRAARDLGSKHDSQTLVLGPIKLKEPEKKEEGTKKEDKA